MVNLNIKTLAIFFNFKQQQEQCSITYEVYFKYNNLREPYFLASNGHTNKVFEHEVITGEIFHFGSDEIPPPPSYTSEGKQYLERSHSAFSPSSVNRSVSFHYGDESVFTSPDPIAYRHYQPRRPGRNRVNRNSSAISTAQLMRHYSDASARQSRLTSIDLSNGGPSRQTSLKSQMPIYDEVQEVII